MPELYYKEKARMGAAFTGEGEKGKGHHRRKREGSLDCFQKEKPE
jgi:hypothetical protein